MCDKRKEGHRALMLKVNDCCWAAGTDPENKYVSKKLGEKQNLPYSKTLEKRKKAPSL
jgi:hypothetical protein